MSKKKTVTDTLYFAFANYFGQILSLIRGFIVAGFLSPSIYGYFGGLSLIQFYSAQGHLGILHGMNKSISIKIGEGDVEGYEKIKNTAFNSIMFLATLVAFGIIFFSFIKREGYSDYLLWGLRTFGLAIILQHLEMIYHSVLRAEYRMNIVSTSRIVFAVTNILLVIIVIRYWGFYGVLVSYFTAYTITSLYLILRSKIKFKIQIDRSIICSLIKTGLPISIMFLIEVILSSVDRIMIIRYLNITQLGYYSIALTLCEALSRLPHAIVYTYFPKILEKYGSNRDISALKDHFEAPSIVLGLSVSFCTGLAFLLIGLFISNFLPAYTGAINASKILLFSVFFMSLSQMATRILITINRNRIIILFQIVVIFFSIWLNLIFIRMNYGILGIAFGTTIAYIVYTFIVLTYTLLFFYKNIFLIIKKQLFLYFPLLYCFFLLTLIDSIFPNHSSISQNIIKDLNSVILPIFIFIVSFLPVSYFMIYRYRNIFSLPSPVSIFNKIRENKIRG